MPDHIRWVLGAVEQAARSIDVDAVGVLVERLVRLRERGGRLFVLGVGGSAANASHAVNDFRKLCGIEAYAPTDNVAELTARTNDEGWETTFSDWLRTSRLSANDAVLVLSVGGGDLQQGVSVNLVRALDEAQTAGAMVLAVVGRGGGQAARIAAAAIIVPTVEQALLTPLAESFQSVLIHAIVSHPELAIAQGRWEGLDLESRTMTNPAVHD